MKRFTILLLSAMMVFAVSCQKDDDEENGSDNFVNQEQETKTAVLEEFTGVRCGYCPDGAAIAADMIATYPGQVIAIGIHGGSYSTPYSGDPDLSTTWADALISFSQLGGFPSGMVSRIDHDSDGKLAMSRSAWKSTAAGIITENAVVNIGIKSEYDADSKEATIKVQYYYTGDAADASNLINVAITESGIITQQAGATGDYEHKHVLRTFLTGQWGETISETSSGSTATLTYTYSVPTDVNPDKCEVVAYITNSNKENILNADETELVNGETD